MDFKGDSSMKKRYLGFATISLVAAFGLAACGSDDKPNSPKDETHFNTLDEAPECTSYNEGDTITVGKNNIQYLCEDNEWVKLKAPSSSNSNGDEPSSSGSEGDENQTTLSEGSLPNGLVIIGHQVWAGQNLDITKNTDGEEIGRCYDNDEENCKIFGRLYTWTEAMQIDSSYKSKNVGATTIKKNHQGLCPEGFHIPTGNDLENLVKYVNSTKVAADYRTKEDMNEGADISGILLRSTTYDANEIKVWSTGEDAVPAKDAFGFMLVGAGSVTERSECEMVGNGKEGDDYEETEVCKIVYENDGNILEKMYFWLSEEDDESSARIANTHFSWTDVVNDWQYKSSANSVRCIMNMTAEEYVKTDEYKKTVEDAKK